MRFNRQREQKNLDKVIPYLVRAAEGGDEQTRTNASEYLFRMRRPDLIPKDLLDKYEEHWTR